MIKLGFYLPSKDLLKCQNVSFGIIFWPCGSFTREKKKSKAKDKANIKVKLKAKCGTTFLI